MKINQDINNFRNVKKVSRRPMIKMKTTKKTKETKAKRERERSPDQRRRS